MDNGRSCPFTYDHDQTHDPARGYKERPQLMANSDFDNPFNDGDRWGDEDGNPLPNGWKEGQAWAKCRLISPDGMDSETEIPKLSAAQGMALNILIMRLSHDLPVEVIYKDELGKAHIFPSHPVPEDELSDRPG